MTRKELVAAVVDAISTEHGRHIKKTTADLVIDAVFAQIGVALVRGQVVHIKGFLSFRARLRPSRPGTHPRTGQPLVIPARRVPTARFNKKFQLPAETPAAQ